MIKKILIFSSVVIIIGLGISGYLILRKKTRNIDTSPFQAIPMNTCVVFECKNFPAFISRLKNENKLWKELTGFPVIQEVNNRVSFLDSLFRANKEFSNIIQNKPVLISIHVTGKENTDILYVLKFSTVYEEEKGKKYIEEWLTGKGNITQRTYDKASIFEIMPKDRGVKKSYSWSVFKGVFIFSSSSLLVEDAVRQLNTGNPVTATKGFRNVLNTAGVNVEGNVYIHFKTFPKLVSVLLNPSYKKFIYPFTDLANWAELDFNLKNDALLLNGFTYSDDSASNYLNIFLKQSPRRIKLTSVLPANTSTFIALCIDNSDQFKTDFRNYLESTGELQNYFNEIEKIKKHTGIDVEELFYSILENEIALVFTDINSLDIIQNQFVVLRSKSKSMAEEQLLELIKKYAAKENRQLDAYTETYSVDEETSFIIYKMPVQYMMRKIFGNIFSLADCSYFTLIDNYLVFGSSVKALSGFIHQKVLNKTLSMDNNFNQFSDYLSSHANFYFYTNIPLSRYLYSYYMNDGLRKAFEENEFTCQKFQALGIQFGSDKGMIYNNIFLKYNPVFKEPPHTAWESHIDTILYQKPRLMVNHYTKDKEIFIQDVRHNCYLINSAGRVLWKLPLQEKITGNVYQIDFYKNGKLQFIFNTRNYIHIIDRNGNYIERYPVKLRDPAVNGLALFDYENNRDYRIFIASEDKKIYVYDKEGNILQGWNFPGSETYVYNEIQYVRIKDKDFIVFSDSLKNYILDRKGNARVILKHQFPRARHSIFYLDEAMKENKKVERLVTTDTSGTVYFIYFNGQVESLSLDEYSSSHFFEYKCIDQDAEEDFIFIDKNKLDVFNQKKNELFSYEFNRDINEPPVVYVFPDNQKKIGVVSRLSGELFLFNSNGTLYEGFPLKGTTPFSIGTLDESKNIFNLIVGSEFNFLYNYEIE